MYTEKPKLLNAKDTQFFHEAWLTDVKHLIEPNAEGDYRCEYVPYDYDEYQRFKCYMDETIDTLNSTKSSYDDRVFKGKYASGKNTMAFYFAQTFTPKLPTTVERYEELEGKKVRLNMHLRDAVDGNVYLACSYIDIIPTDASEEFVTANTDEDDW